MTTFPGSPKVLKGGFILMDADGRAVLRVIPFQYNPETLLRTLTPRGAKAETGDRLEALRLVGPPIETLKLEIVLDATDRLEKPAQNPTAVSEGIAADLAELEMMIAPATADIAAAEALAQTGTLEILPLPSPLILLVLGANRTLPVRITEFSVDRRGVRSAAEPDPGADRAGDAGADHRRPALWLERRRAVPDRGAAARDAGGAAGGRGAGAGSGRSAVMDSPFPPNSRYFEVPVLTRTGPDGQVQTYPGRRLLPAMSRFVAIDRVRAVGQRTRRPAGLGRLRRSGLVVAHRRCQRRSRPRHAGWPRGAAAADPAAAGGGRRWRCLVRSPSRC